MQLAQGGEQEVTAESDPGAARGVRTASAGSSGGTYTSSSVSSPAAARLCRTDVGVHTARSACVASGRTSSRTSLGGAYARIWRGSGVGPVGHHTHEEGHLASDVLDCQ